MRAAIHRKASHIEVRADPNDLSAVFLIDSHGVHRIANVTNDSLLIHEGSIGDLCSMNDEQKMLNVLTASQTDQDACDLAAFRHETIAVEKSRKQAAQRIKNTAAPKTQYAGVREAQAREKSLLLDESLPQSGLSDTLWPSSAPSDIGNPIQPPPQQLTSLEQLRMQRLMDLMAKKKELQ